MNNYSCNLTVVTGNLTGGKELKELRGNWRWIFFFFMSVWWPLVLYSPAVTQAAPPHAGAKSPLSFLCYRNVSYTRNMSSRRETSPLLITAQSNKPVLHNSSNIAIFTWEAELLIYSCAAFPHVSLTPSEQRVLHQGHNGWFDLKRSNYPQQWRDLIVYWRRRESVTEVKLEVIVSGRCGERWNGLIGCCVQLSENKGRLIRSYQWLGWGPWGGPLYAYWYKSFWRCYASKAFLSKSQCFSGSLLP